MAFGKAAYLKRLTSKMRFRSVEVGEKMEGTTPPSVFIGSAGYPKVYAGPMLTPQQGNTSILDSPEDWIPQNRQTADIVNFRLQLVRGKEQVGIRDLDNKLVQKLQEISLAENSISGDAEFKHKPRGFYFNEEHQPFGPSASLKHLSLDNARWHPQLEKTYYDTDFKAADAMVGLYARGLSFSQMQKALSTGTMGIGRNRRLVPTRWSITALDDTLGKHLVDEVKHNEVIGGYEVYEFSALDNYFAILLTPTTWQYEWMEAFIHVLGKEELIFSDWEGFKGKKEYSSVGGCFYSVRFAIAEALSKQKRQAGAIVFREAYQDYIPMGVWLCREETRHAMAAPARTFDSLHSSLAYISTKLKLPMQRYRQSSHLLEDVIKARQTLLVSYV